MLNRRNFLAASASLALAAMVGAKSIENRLAVSTWSFHNYFPNTRYGKPEFELQEWKLEKVLSHIQEKLGIASFELSSAHLQSHEPDYLDDLKALGKKNGWKFIHMSDNMKGVNLAKADASKREEDFQRFVTLINTTSRLGIPTMRINTGTPEKPDWDLGTTIDQYKKLASIGKTKGVEIIIENHFGISADPLKVEKIILAVGDNISSCPDFGLFKSEQERQAGLPVMFKHARRVCSAKFHGFTPEGKPKDFDLQSCYKTMKDSNYPGWISLEYEGPQEPTAPLAKMKSLASEWMG